MKEKFTGERLETYIYNENTIKHLHRYAIASSYIEKKIVLDIACGEGYGSNHMSNYAEFVYGVDIDFETITNAKKKYSKSNLTFLEGSTSKIPIENNSVDVVVSYETIEHHNEHEQMLEEIKRVLKPNGLLIISTPDKYYYSDLRNYNNPFHIKELYKDEFIALTNKYFKHSQLLSQSFLNGNSLVLKSDTRNVMKYYSGDFIELTEVTSNPEFLIAILSDQSFKQQDDSIFEGSEINSKRIKKEINIVYNSNSYKVGHALLTPFKFLKHKIRGLNLRK